jgi:hypothetical protein
MHPCLIPRSAWRLASPLVVSLALLMPSSARQSIRQEDGKPLQPPQLSGTGPSDFTGFTIASLSAIPFSAVIEAENTYTDANGTVIVHLFHTKVARDSQGRTRVDVNLNPEGAPADARLLQTFIEDPVRKRTIILFHAQKVAVSRSTVPPRPRKSSGSPISIEPPELSGIFAPVPQTELQQEELAPEVLDGMTVRHGRRRESTTYPDQSTSLGHSTTTISDYWFSPELQAFLLVKQVGPDAAVHTLRLRDISRLEPAAALFRVPRGYYASKPTPPSR